MEYSYVTATQVARELRVTDDFSSSTVPTLESIQEWIKQESAEVNGLSGRKYGITSYSEVIDYSGEEIITLKNAPVQEVTDVLYSGWSLGTTEYSLTEQKVEDRDYAVYAEEGEIAILPGWAPQVGRKRIQIDYLAGFSEIPGDIQKLVAKKVAKRTIDTLLSKDVNEKQSGKSVSVGSISIVKPANFGVTQYGVLKNDIDELETKILKGTSAYRIGGHRF